MKITAYATISIHQFMAKSGARHFYAELFDHIRQDKNRLRLDVCRVYRRP